jgi:CubicO group peptidase (beta-lactamase class C family)
MNAMLRSFLVAAIALAGATSAYAQTTAGWPTKGWASASPESQGVDTSVLGALDRKFASGQHGYVDGMLLIRNGRVVYEKSYQQDYDAAFDAQDQKTRGQYNYYDPDWHPYFERGQLHTMQSVSKSVMSALIGIAIRRAEITGTDVKVLRYFDGVEPAHLDAKWEAMTLRDLLTMTAGIRWDESTVGYSDPKNSCAAMEQSADWIRYILDQPMAATPSERFVYNSGVTVMLAHILWKATGQHGDVYAKEHLFGPLGIDSFYWKKTPTGLVDAEGGLYLTARDLAKFGYLYANDGVWDGQRVLPEGWVAATMAPAVDVSDKDDRKYGYQWWLLPYEGGASKYAYACLGYGGQRLFVLPEFDLVAVITGWNIYDRPQLSAAKALERVLRSVRP